MSDVIFSQAAIIFTICFPFLAGLVISFAKKSSKLQGTLVYIAAIVEIIAGLTVAIGFFAGGCQKASYFVNTEIVDYLMVAGDIFLMCLITVMAIKKRKYFAIPLTVVPTIAIVIFELFLEHKVPEAEHLMIDRLAALMIMIIVVVGGLICCYAVGYMKGYHHHHADVKDRTNYFLPLLVVFLGAMSGLVLSANMVWLCFFWEVTSTISFLLIGYVDDETAVKNSFKAIWMNLLGGCGIVGAIYYSFFAFGTVDLATLLSNNPYVLQLPLALLAFAALTKSAQFPFSGWLLGAMCAPTPSSALLHSATMVKAGVYLLIRLAPAMSGGLAGILVAYIGGFTFFVASMLAITVSDGKSVLAYSTISNLGLMVACCGIGTEAAIFGAIMLMMFHAVSKSMLFQAVGAVENSTGSRDIEDLHGLILRLPKLAVIIMIGILGMYTAPFGMLVSKWAALKAFVDAKSIILVLLLVFGSGTTMFYWTKFLTKILSQRVSTPVEDKTVGFEYVSMFIHAALVIGICAALSFVVKGFVEPMVGEMFGAGVIGFEQSELFTLAILLLFMFLIPLLMYWVSKDTQTRKVPAYMAGINTGDNNSFVDAFGGSKEMNIANWYMEEVFGAKKLTKPCNWISAAFIAVMIALIAVGGAL